MKKKSNGKTIYLLLITAIVAIGLSSCNSEKKNTYKDSLDLSARDTSVSPAQDFFEYANGTWLKKTKIPADKVGWGSYITLREKVSEQIKGILDSCAALKNPEPGSPVQQIGDLYASAMDSVAIEKAGISPLKKSLSQIESIQNVPDLLTVVSTDKVDGYGALAPFYYGVEPDAKNSNVERMGFYQGGLGLPNKTYYFKTDSAGKAVMADYHQLITKLLTLSGEDSTVAVTHAGDIIALETKMAAASKSPVELRDPKANYHLLTLKDMDKIAPQFHWNTLLTAFRVKEDTLVVEQPEFYKALSGLLTATPISIWKEYLKFHLILNHSDWLSSPFFNARFSFIQSLTGMKASPPRWQRASGLVNGELGDALGKIYVERYFPPSAKAYMEKMVDNLKAAFKEHIQNLDWMSDSTKAKALDKLNAMVKKIGYPDKWKDYSSIHINRSSVIDNMRQIGIWRYHYNLNKLGKPVDRSEWFMTPPTVNAYYNPTSNDINFPAGYLQPPYYFQHGDDAVNYGSIGETIGHEMTHGFDDQGSQFDKDGNLKNWWTKADRKKFEEHAARIVKQYDNYMVLDTVHVNGELTEGENIADNGGLAIAYTAFQKTPEAHKDTLIDGLTPDQRFFLSFAQEWRVKVRPQILQTRINTDPHSPENYRVNGSVSNMPAFYKAFNVKPGDKMYRPDSVRVHIW
ncbi:MAG TPA: M13 family metallopeptidase [Hanamia sp.]|nr:M13 family metallopeptidase [Hanamia sp.]